MIGYKGFDKNFCCKDFQFAVGQTFTLDDEPVICERGFHFCDFPLAIWEFYPPANSRFALVESLGVIVSDEDNSHKFCTNKLKIIKELSLKELIDCAIDLHKKSSGTNVPAINSGDQSLATNSGLHSSATNSGNYSSATNSGNFSLATNSGNFSLATNSGFCSVAANSGFYSSATNSGDYSSATNSGDQSSATNSGNFSSATNSGIRSSAINSGDQSSATNSGDFSSATNSGNFSLATNSGFRSVAVVEGEQSIAIVTGIKCRAKGSLGCWIVLTERDCSGSILNIKAFKVDGVNIKPDTFYSLENSLPVEVSEEGES